MRLGLIPLNDLMINPAFLTLIMTLLGVVAGDRVLAAAPWLRPFDG